VVAAGATGAAVGFGVAGAAVGVFVQAATTRMRDSETATRKKLFLIQAFLLMA
jgi:hypothetical protein